jgi:hypothetical protein
MTRRYYSSRAKNKSLSLEDLYVKLQNLYLYFRDREYFKWLANITNKTTPALIKYEAGIALDFRLFPITDWLEVDITEDHIFDAIEFLFDYVSAPCDYGLITDETGFSYSDFQNHDKIAGQLAFREKANMFLSDYKNGYELKEEGIILALGQEGLQYILDAKILPYDEVNVDSKVRQAITKWRNRDLNLSEKKEAIREMADVFEWLKKTNKLKGILERKDESDLFEIANKFDIRHHDPKQNKNYDRNIWYAWIFHFYLATYHAVIRMLLKKQEGKKH